MTGVHMKRHEGRRTPCDDASKDGSYTAANQGTPRIVGCIEAE